MGPGAAYLRQHGFHVRVLGGLASEDGEGGEQFGDGHEEVEEEGCGHADHKMAQGRPDGQPRAFCPDYQEKLQGHQVTQHKKYLENCYCGNLEWEVGIE